MSSGAPNRHATVAQLREVLATLRDDDCVHTNLMGNLTVIRAWVGFDDLTVVKRDDHIGYIELASGDLDEPPRAIWCDFGDEDRR